MLSAPSPHRCQDEYLPIIESLASAVFPSFPVDIFRHELQNLLSHGLFAVDHLQRPQDRNNFITALEIQLDVFHGRAIESCLLGNSFSHESAPRRLLVVFDLHASFRKDRLQEIVSSRSVLHYLSDNPRPISI